MVFALPEWTRIGTPDDAVAVAQWREMRRQVPFLYALLIVNGAAVAYTHRAVAPLWLTLWAAVALASLSAVRMVHWLTVGTRQQPDGLGARRALRRTTLLSAVLAAGYVGWAVALDDYGGPMERAHVALFIAITVIGCIFCLICLPQAALAVTVIVTGAYLVHYLPSGDTVWTAIALNIAAVTLVMVQVMFNSFRAFTALVRSREELGARQAESERLGRENALLAHTDSLTGLPNRRYFLARLEAMLAERNASGGRFVVGVLDLDRFKPVNDTHGHVVGDRLLTQVGERLRGLATPSMLIARLGGDEFGMTLVDDVDHAQAIGQSFCDALTMPFQLDDIRITIGCSCGLAAYPEAGTSAHALFDRSDYALYHAKSHGRGGAALFSLEHETAIRSERAIETALQEADLDAELDVHFQPIIDTAAMRVISVEALARWTSPLLGRVPPDQFIPTAERLGLIRAITLSLFRKASAAAAQLPQEIGLSFNLSALDIASPETIAALVEAITTGPVPAARITFELTETALMRDFDRAVAAMRRLRALGAQIALDDFGTGYSSLGYLRLLPLDKIKVDRSFAADLQDVSGRNIVTAIFGLCRNLALDCVIEGVESEEQLLRLQELGYRLVQGYLFARPMPLPALRTWLARDLGAGAALAQNAAA
ncbi:putative bifunctional diguanylate cyclase/phosphodiesterase [Sphingomonas morindae]|uniref:EAL domain-containing protein n=1 Tax=Sphingomonas morindae TaxID=1541170 RepID=A0ABY4X3I8_9SPHN|nr:EAL domain-containing protein [Sphingomonas morindae]USI71449.1 EAL domain-containing protein [Sphingomonas morindae]